MLFERTKGGYRRATQSSPLDLVLFFLAPKKNGTLSPANLANDENKNLPRPRVPLSPFSLSSSSSSPASLIEAVPRVGSPSSPHILAAVRFQQNRRTLFPFAVIVVVGLRVVGPGGCPARSYRMCYEMA